MTQVPYFYADDRHPSFIDDAGEFQHTPLIELKDGLSKPLGQVVDRLKPLGHSLATSEQAYVDYLDDLDLDHEVSFDDPMGAVITWPRFWPGKRSTARRCSCHTFAPI